MNVQELVAQYIREILVCLQRNAETAEFMYPLDELARLFGVDLEAIVKDLAGQVTFTTTVHETEESFFAALGLPMPKHAACEQEFMAGAICSLPKNHDGSHWTA